MNSNGNSSTQLTSFITELDYAFDITLYDDLPEELGNITNISDGGVYDATKNYITWPTIAKTTATALLRMILSFILSMRRWFLAEITSITMDLPRFMVWTH